MSTELLQSMPTLEQQRSLARSICLDQLQQRQAIATAEYAKACGLPGVLPPNGISFTAVHNHPQPAKQSNSGLLSKLAGPAALLMGGALGGAGLLSAFRPNSPAPIIAPVSKETTNTTTTTTAPPLIQPPAKNPNYRIGVE